jgi:hypothetical protein
LQSPKKAGYAEHSMGKQAWRGKAAAPLEAVWEGGASVIEGTDVPSRLAARGKTLAA